MSDEKQETMADIVREMRNYAKQCREENFGVAPECEAHYNEDDVEYLADRIEAAWKRERAKVEAARHKPVDNAMMRKAILAIKDINDRRPHDADGYKINDIINDILSDPAPTAEKSSEVGNESAMREALETPETRPEQEEGMSDTHGVNGEGWIGFDLDGTLAKYDGWQGIDHIGEPIGPMVDLMKKLHGQRRYVKIVTARVAPQKLEDRTFGEPYITVPQGDGGATRQYASQYIQDWCHFNLGFVPEIVYQKDCRMLELYDDRVKQVVPNKGVLVEDLANYYEALVECHRHKPGGNVAAMLEALETMNKLFEHGVICTSYANSAEEIEQIEELYRKAKAALSLPPRQCDVGTAEEQIKRWEKFCQEHHEYWKPGKSLTAIQRCNCPCHEGNGCNYFIWAQMKYEAEEGGAK